MTDQTPQPETPPNPLAPEKVVVGGKPVYGNGRAKARNYGEGIRKYTSHFCNKLEAELQAIADSPRVPLMKRTAARLVLRAAVMDAAGIALALKLIEHTDGSAVKRVDATIHSDQAVTFVHRNYDELVAEAQEFLEARQKARKLVGGNVTQQEPEPVEGVVHDPGH